jgi:hypothetical protein
VDSCGSVIRWNNDCQCRMEYTWTIAQLERNTADDFVTIVHYRVTAVDGELHLRKEDVAGNGNREYEARY